MLSIKKDRYLDVFVMSMLRVMKVFQGSLPPG
jgi:hypothetical protein